MINLIVVGDRGRRGGIGRQGGGGRVAAEGVGGGRRRIKPTARRQNRTACKFELKARSWASLWQG